ncbi:MAG: GDSL-type esterase/lipase family protein [Pygmaiobacter sp.]|nr:GDSL-type esterase/lipase family protein [Pygmaiobacter sp.]
MDYRNYYRADRKKRRRIKGFQRFILVVLVILLLLGLAAVITKIIEVVRGGDASQGTSLPATSSVSQPVGSTSTGSSAPAGQALPEKGRVELAYFSDAAFVGDSITTGWVDYKGAASLPDTHVIAAIGVTPPVNGVQWANSDGSTYDPVQTIVDAAPQKLYLMFGANKLVDQSTTAEDTLVSDYGKFIDDLQAKLPNAKIYVQSILLPTAAATQEKPGLSPERITRVNARLQSLAAQKGCYYVNLNESLCPAGVLQDGYAANDGLHLSKEGYIAWLEYLITHAAYDPANPYVGGIDPGA